MKPARTILALLVATMFAVSAVADEWWSSRAIVTSGSPDGESLPSPIVDPLGDATGVLGGPPPFLDIDTIDVTYDPLGRNLFFSMTFHTPIAPFSAGRPESLIGILEFDIDQNAATGQAPIQNQFSPPFASLRTGVDVIVILADERQALLEVIDLNRGTVGEVKAIFGPMSLAGSLPFEWIRNDDGIVDFTAAVGTLVQPTDAMDVVGYSVPEPSTLFLLVTAGLAFLGHRSR